MSREDQQVRWQHLPLVFGGIALFIGVVTFAMSFIAEPPGPPRGPSPEATRLIGGSLAVPGLILLIVGIRALRALRRREKLDALSKEVAFEVPPDIKTPDTISLGAAVRRHFDLPPGNQPVIPRGARLTVGDVHRWLCNRLPATRECVQPGQFEMAAASVSRVTARPASDITPLDDLNRLIPRDSRWKFWQEMRRVAPQLPRLGLSPFVATCAGIVALAITYSIVVPLAQAGDKADPHWADHLPFIARAALKLFVRGGFFLLLGLLCFTLARILVRRFPHFPEDLHTVRELARHLPADPGGTGWTPDLIWKHLQVIVGLQRKCEPSTVQRSDTI